MRAVEVTVVSRDAVLVADVRRLCALAGVALALRGRPDEAMEALGRGVAMRPVNGPGLRDEITLASLRGRRDFEALTAPIGQ